MQQHTIETFQLLAHPQRLRMLEVMSDEPLTLHEISERMPISYGTVRVHLWYFTNVGLLIRHPARPGEDGRLLRYEVDRELLESHLAVFAEAVGIGLPVRKRVADTAARATDNNRVPAKPPPGAATPGRHHVGKKKKAKAKPKKRR
jgi:DNA-binding transcriptional ArsR family regulator